MIFSLEEIESNYLSSDEQFVDRFIVLRAMNFALYIDLKSW